MRAKTALDRFCRHIKGRKVLNIGDKSNSEHCFMINTHTVCNTVNLEPPCDYLGDFAAMTDLPKFDAVWCSHVLEHMPNVGQALQAIDRFSNEGALICITVPPPRNRLVGGHINKFTPDTLVYHCILAGWDMSEARVIVDGYDQSAFFYKKSIALPRLKMDKGDIETLAPYFPAKWGVFQGIELKDWRV